MSVYSECDRCVCAWLMAKSSASFTIPVWKTSFCPLSVSLFVYLSVCLPVSICLFFFCLFTCLFNCTVCLLLLVSLSVCMSLCLSVCLSALLCLSVSRSVCLYVYYCLSLCLSVCLNYSACLLICMSDSRSVCMSLCLPAYLSACLSVYLFTCLSTCMSLCLSVCFIKYHQSGRDTLSKTAMIILAPVAAYTPLCSPACLEQQMRSIAVGLWPGPGGGCSTRALHHRPVMDWASASCWQQWCLRPSLPSHLTFFGCPNVPHRRSSSSSSKPSLYRRTSNPQSARHKAELKNRKGGKTFVYSWIDISQGENTA